MDNIDIIPKHLRFFLLLFNTFKNHTFSQKIMHMPNMKCKYTKFKVFYLLVLFIYFISSTSSFGTWLFRTQHCISTQFLIRWKPSANSSYFLELFYHSQGFLRFGSRKLFQVVSRQHLNLEIIFFHGFWHQNALRIRKFNQ